MNIKKGEYTIALLIDGENAQTKCFSEVKKHLADYGRVTHKRVYGCSNTIDSWMNIVNTESLTICVQPEMTKTYYSDGETVKPKNASDIKLAIDAMKILHEGKVDAFCIMSSDSDYTPLVKELREAGMVVIGAANARNTPAAFINACDDIIPLGMADAKKEEEKPKKSEKNNGKKPTVKKETEKPAEAEVKPQAAKSEIAAIPTKSEIIDFVRGLFVNNEVTVLDAGEITKRIRRVWPSFQFKDYGAKKSQDFFREDFKPDLTEGGSINIYLKDKDKK